MILNFWNHYYSIAWISSETQSSNGKMFRFSTMPLRTSHLYINSLLNTIPEYQWRGTPYSDSAPRRYHTTSSNPHGRNHNCSLWTALSGNTYSHICVRQVVSETVCLYHLRLPGGRYHVPDGSYGLSWQCAVRHPRKTPTSSLWRSSSCSHPSTVKSKILNNY